MKRILAVLLSAVVLAVASIGLTGLTGCATTGNSPFTGQQLTNAAGVLKLTTRQALILIVQNNGVTNTVPYLIAAKGALDTVLGGTNYTPGELEAAITSLPVSQLKSAEVQLAISGFLGAYEIYYGDYVQGQVNGDVTAVVLLQAVRDGISLALDAAQAPPGTIKFVPERMQLKKPNSKNSASCARPNYFCYGTAHSTERRT